jgi:hypothetical protein
MRALLILLASLSVVVAVHAADAVTGRVIKVLPFLVDRQGRIAKSPSLFDRDAYQSYLLQHTNEVSGMRFDVQWKAVKSPDEKLKLQVELRGVATNAVPTIKTMVTNVVAGTYSQWTYIPLAGQDYKNFGSVAAWRVTLWNDSQQLGEQKSFLW